MEKTNLITDKKSGDRVIINGGFDVNVRFEVTLSFISLH